MPVRVKLLDLKKFHGQCYREKNHFLIKLHKPNIDLAQLSKEKQAAIHEIIEQMLIDAFLHEYAHARAWSLRLDKADLGSFEKILHQADWGVAYAEVYSAYEKEFCQ